MYKKQFATIIKNENIDYESIKNEWLYEKNQYSIRDNNNKYTVFDFLKGAVEGKINIHKELDYFKTYFDIKDRIIDESILKLDKRILELEIEEYNRKGKNDDKYHINNYIWRSLEPQKGFSLIYSIRYFKAVLQENIKGNLDTSFF